MGRHVAPRRWFGRGRTRALLALGTVFALGAVGTSAYWTDTATITGGTITSGSMDLQLQTPSSASWVHVGSGTSATDATLAIGNLTPNEYHAFDVAARNVGNADFTYTATVAQAGSWTYVNTPITVQFFTGGRVGAEDTSYPIQETCSGTALATVPVAAGPTTVIPSRPLALGASEQLCVRVGMVQDATDTNQNKSGQLRFDFTATQVTS